MRKNPKQNKSELLNAQYKFDAYMVNLRINSQFMQEANELSAKWRKKKLKNNIKEKKEQAAFDLMMEERDA